MPDLFVEIGSVLVLDDTAAFLADRFVETLAVPLARDLAALAPDRLVEPVSVALANGVAALFPSFPHGHFSVRGSGSRGGPCTCHIRPLHHHGDGVWNRAGVLVALTARRRYVAPTQAATS